MEIEQGLRGVDLWLCDRVNGDLLELYYNPRMFTSWRDSVGWNQFMFFVLYKAVFPADHDFNLKKKWFKKTILIDINENPDITQTNYLYT